MHRGFWVLLVVLSLTPGCFQPRPERPRDRITRVRLGYRVSANWREMEKGKAGGPVLVMQLNVANTGKETLPEVTMVLHVRELDGSERVRKPLTLDTRGIAPGATRTITVRVPGIDVQNNEEVSLEMEGQPSVSEMKSYPEYKGVS
jgi:hypothetical protein